MNCNSKLFHIGNLNRVIRVRSILVKGIDKESDVLNLNNLEDFKKEVKKNNFLRSQTMSKIGQPSFIRNKFSVRTSRKLSDGNYFGLKN